MSNVQDFIGTVILLEALEDDVYDLHRLNSRPNGAEYVSIVLEIAQNAIEKGLYKKITPADLDELTADNYHTARRAAEILIELEKYA